MEREEAFSLLHVVTLNLNVTGVPISHLGHMHLLSI